jgi:ABC-type cobalamin/Fe3+-siderophores transport system ATPase subunit
MESFSVGYGETTVIRRSDCEILPGRFTCLIGPNGCGKSTLIKALCGLLPYSGSLELDGREVRNIARKEFGRMVGVVPQNATFNYRYTVYEVIGLGRLPHKSIFSQLNSGDDEKILGAAVKTGVDKLLFRDTSALSGGEKQRVMISMLLAQEPEIFLLDEPSSSLDPKHGIEVFSMLRGLAEIGKTVVAAVHDINTVQRFADDFIAIKDGRFLANGPVKKLDGEILHSLYETRFSPYFSEKGDIAWHA